MEFNSKNQEFEDSLKKQIIEQKIQLMDSINDFDNDFLNNISESALILTLSKFTSFKIFMKQFKKT
jgi:hypothetical protein